MTHRQSVGLDLLPAAWPSLARLPAALTRLLDPGPIPRLRRRRLRRLRMQTEQMDGLRRLRTQTEQMDGFDGTQN